MKMKSIIVGIVLLFTSAAFGAESADGALEVSVYAIPMNVTFSVSPAPSDILKDWEAHLVLRGSSAEGLWAKIQTIVETTTIKTDSAAGLRWAFVARDGGKTVRLFYDPLSKIVLRDGRKWQAPAELVNLVRQLGPILDSTYDWTRK